MTNWLLTWLINRYDVGGDGYLDLEELKITMERLKAPQTHLSLKAMISELDQDGDGKLSFAEVIARPIWRSPREPHAWCFQLL